MVEKPAVKCCYCVCQSFSVWDTCWAVVWELGYNIHLLQRSIGQNGMKTLTMECLYVKYEPAVASPGGRKENKN